MINPNIKDRIVIVWLGGNALDFGDTYEFNMYQDVAAARVILDSGAAVVLFPCMGVVSSFTVSGDDMRARFYGKNKISTYLTENAETEISSYVEPGRAWSRIIWDVTAVAWLTTSGHHPFIRYRHIPAPIPEYNNTYSFDEGRNTIVYVYYIERDAI